MFTFHKLHNQHSIFQLIKQGCTYFPQIYEPLQNSSSQRITFRTWCTFHPGEPLTPLYKMSLSKEIRACSLWTSAVKHPKSEFFSTDFLFFKFPPIQLCASVFTSHHGRILSNGYSLLIINPSAYTTGCETVWATGVLLLILAFSQ
jgi:hypothetical protein